MMLLKVAEESSVQIHQILNMHTLVLHWASVKNMWNVAYMLTVLE